MEIKIKSNSGGAGINILLLITFLPIIITCLAGLLSYLLGCESGMEGSVHNCYFKSADAIISNMVPAIWLAFFTVPIGVVILILIAIVSAFKKIEVTALSYQLAGQLKAKAFSLVL